MTMTEIKTEYGQLKMKELKDGLVVSEVVEGQIVATHVLNDHQAERFREALELILLSKESE